MTLKIIMKWSKNTGKVLKKHRYLYQMQLSQDSNVMFLIPREEDVFEVKHKREGIGSKRKMYSVFYNCPNFLPEEGKAQELNLK